MQTIDASTHLRGTPVLLDWIRANGLDPDNIVQIDRETCDGNYLIIHRHDLPVRLDHRDCRPGCLGRSHCVAVVAMQPPTTQVEQVAPPKPVLAEFERGTATLKHDVPR